MLLLDACRLLALEQDERIEVIKANVDVLNVTTLILPKKRGQRGRKSYVRSPEFKKAVVTLPEGQTIAEFNI